MTANTIDILLATFDGERHLQAQLDSVLAQKGVDLRILARDDGSTDSTLTILNGYASAHPHRMAVVHNGPPTGSARGNFAKLLEASTAPYAAFCDQDDVWLPTKLKESLALMRRLEAVHGMGKPLLVYTDLRVVDEHLRTQAASLWQANGLRNAASPTFESLLSENVVTGCTALMNRALICAMQPIPATAPMHDHWAALVAAGTGALAALATPTVLYRQHGSNVVGAVSHISLREKLHRLVGASGASARAKQHEEDRAHAASFRDLHGSELPPQQQSSLNAFLALNKMGRVDKIRSLATHHLWRNGTQRKLAQFLDAMRNTPRGTV